MVALVIGLVLGMLISGPIGGRKDKIELKAFYKVYESGETALLFSPRQEMIEVDDEIIVVFKPQTKGERRSKVIVKAVEQGPFWPFQTKCKVDDPLPIPTGPVTVIKQRA